jgi:8-hydroxy-5-deazaflavin:NADPH oxidoreductase
MTFATTHCRRLFDAPKSPWEVRMKFGIVLLVVLAAAIPTGRLNGQEKPTVAIIGTGNLAGTLGPALGRSGYSVVYGSRDPERDAVRSLVQLSGSQASAVSPRQAAALAQVIILAVPGEVVQQVAAELGELRGKIIIDVSGGEKRIAADGYLELVSDSARAERIQAMSPASRVVRLNIPSIAFFSNPLLLATRPTVLIAGNDPSAREAAAMLIFDLGLDPWDAGPLRFARTFDAINTMNMVTWQQGRMEGYELKMLPGVPLPCFIPVAEAFGFGQPYDLHRLPNFPRRDPVVSCEEWGRRLGPPYVEKE